VVDLPFDPVTEADRAALPLHYLLADVTADVVLTPGVLNSVPVVGPSVSDLQVLFGAGLKVIIDDGTGPAELFVHDGLDYAHAPEPAPRDSTVKQVFNFADRKSVV